MCLLAAFGGCYMDATAGAGYAGGGVKGAGWQLGLAFGVGWDIGHVFRPSVGYGANMTHVGASDGKYGTTGYSIHGRADIALSQPDPSGQLRAIFEYGRGGHDELHFVAENDPNRYISHATSQSFFLGLGGEFGSGSGLSEVAVSYGLGPQVLYEPNDFVGDTTTVGLQAHVGFWWIPNPRENHHHSALDLLDNVDSNAQTPEQKTREQTCHTVETTTTGGPNGNRTTSRQVCE
jgi:hypothetical protein